MLLTGRKFVMTSVLLLSKSRWMKIKMDFLQKSNFSRIVLYISVSDGDDVHPLELGLRLHCFHHHSRSQNFMNV